MFYFYKIIKITYKKKEGEMMECDTPDFMWKINMMIKSRNCKVEEGGGESADRKG